MENATQSSPSHPGSANPRNKSERRVSELTRTEFDTMVAVAVFKGLLAFSFLAGLIWLLLVVGAS